MRSRRPRLETILSLLVALNKLTVRIPEGEALQCLTERAMAWRDRAQKVLDANDVVEALKKLSEHNKSDTLGNKKGGRKGKKKTGDADDTESEQSALDTSMTDSESGLEAEISQSKSSDETHADGSKDKRICDKEKDVSASRPPEIKLSSKSLTTLENLMIEGDLLEVSMDETQHIWRVLQATEPRRSKRYPDLNKLEEQLENVREEKIKAKKRRRLELAAKAKAEQEAEEEQGPKAKKAREDKSKKPQDKKQQSRRKRKTSENSEQEEEQEDCSANPKCLRPTGKEVYKINNVG